MLVTFLPYPSIRKSVSILDTFTLRNQRIIAKLILNTLDPKHSDKLMSIHPGVEMWRGYEEMLKGYLDDCTMEWMARGYPNTMITQKVHYAKMRIPRWWAKKEIHSSHRAMLLKKNPKYYSKFKWKDSNDRILWP